MAESANKPPCELLDDGAVFDLGRDTEKLIFFSADFGLGATCRGLLSKVSGRLKSDEA